MMKRRDFVKQGLAAGTSAMAVPAALAGGAPLQKGAFVHCVYFWLKDDLTAEQRAQFEEGLALLVGIDTVKHGFYGTPAGTDRPIIDRSYSYALVCVFDGEAGHDAYQVHPDHDVFRQTRSSLWKEVKIYDFRVQG